jgi:hypothetical protein
MFQVQAVLLSAAHYVQLGCLEELPATAGIGARAFQAMALVQWRECNNVEAARQFFQQVSLAARTWHLIDRQLAQSLHDMSCTYVSSCSWL